MGGRAAIAVAVAALGGCTASPTVRGFAGQKGLSVDAGASRCPVSPTRPNRGPSAGCGKPATQPLAQYAEHALRVDCAGDGARDRLYYVRLPPGYDPAKPYPTVYLGPGCGPPQNLVGSTKAYALETASDPDAILIEMEQGFYNKAEYNGAGCVDPTQMDGGTENTLCHYCFDDGAGTTDPDSVEYGYFDLLHKAVEEQFCVDTDRQFFAGYSSGGWMAHQLGCQFPDVLRAQGSVTGGLPFAIQSGAKACVDHPIAAFLIHDAMDSSNVYAGSLAALERLLALNGCEGGWTMTTAPKEPYTIAGVPNNANLSCVRYTGCPATYPIVFCTSRGQAHGAQAPTAVPGFWQFFKSL
jgi:polyhydroxybutyrate depolymerase